MVPETHLQEARRRLWMAFEIFGWFGRVETEGHSEGFLDRLRGLSAKGIPQAITSH